MENIQPLFNASMNFCSATLLVLGFLAIKKGQAEIHKKFMIAALGTSTLFLMSYLYYHYKVGHNVYEGPESMKVAYYVFLASHIFLAVVMLPFIAMTFFYGFRGQLKSHKKLAKFTLPVWLYVSVTGVLLYLIVYQIAPESFKLKPIQEKQKPIPEAPQNPPLEKI